MKLFAFKSEVGASTIPAAALDANFSMLRPLQSSGYPRQYALTETPQGWAMTIFPQFPQAAGGLHVLGIQNGQLRWVPTESCA
jgi:hypothetical protein